MQLESQKGGLTRVILTESSWVLDWEEFEGEKVQAESE